MLSNHHPSDKIFINPARDWNSKVESNLSCVLVAQKDQITVINANPWNKVSLFSKSSKSFLRLEGKVLTSHETPVTCSISSESRRVGGQHICIHYAAESQSATLYYVKMKLGSCVLSTENCIEIQGMFDQVPLFNRATYFNVPTANCSTSSCGKSKAKFFPDFQ